MIRARERIIRGKCVIPTYRNAVHLYFAGNNEEILVLLSPGTHNYFSLGKNDSGVPNGRTIYRGAGVDTIVSGGVVRDELGQIAILRIKILQLHYPYSICVLTKYRKLFRPCSKKITN